MVTLRLLKPPPCGVVIGAFRKTLLLAQGIPGARVYAGGIAAQIDLFANLDGVNLDARAGFLNDVKRRCHDLGADAVAVGDRNTGLVCHTKSIQ